MGLFLTATYDCDIHAFICYNCCLFSQAVIKTGIPRENGAIWKTSNGGGKNIEVSISIDWDSVIYFCGSLVMAVARIWKLTKNKYISHFHK